MDENYKLRRSKEFWSNVEAGKPNECWNWNGPLYEGYGSFSLKRGMKAHRAAQFLFGEPPLPGQAVDHICRNRACVNPAHLRNISMVDNTMCGEAIPARNSRKTHCYKGHPFTPENTYWFGPGLIWRQCRTCHSATNARLKRRRKAALAANETQG